MWRDYEKADRATSMRRYMDMARAAQHGTCRETGAIADGPNEHHLKNQIISMPYTFWCEAFRATFLDFGRRREFNPRTSRKDVLFDPPPGP
jgi:hypothetical protein